MEDKQAIEILMRMLDRDSLSDEEKEAVRTAVGILSWSALGQARIKNMGKAQKAKKEWRPRDNELLKQSTYPQGREWTKVWNSDIISL